MTDPKTLQEIAEQARIFDRAHFADGNDPEVDPLLRHHETLKTDPKLIARLVPRFAVALGYFEGYAKAVEDRAWSEMNAAERSLKEFDPKNIGIVKRPPPPPPPMPNIDLYIRQGICDRRPYRVTRHAVVESGYDGEWKAEMDASTIVVAYKFAILDLVKRIDECEETISATAKQAAEWRDRLEQIDAVSQTKLGARNDDSMTNEISDELAQAAAHYVNVETRDNDIPSDLERVHKSLTMTGDDLDLPWSARARAFVNGARWQAARGVQVELDRLLKGQSMPDTDDDVQAGSRGLSVEEAIHRYAPGPYPTLAEISEAWFGSAGNVAVDAASRVLALFALKRVEVPEEPIVDRRWMRLHALRDGAVFETANGIRSVKSKYKPNGNIECVLLSDGSYAGFGVTTEKHNDVLVRELVLSDREETKAEPIRDAPLAPTPIVFRDNEERSFWDAMTLVLARKGDTTSQSVASAADELVEERRARIPHRIVSETEEPSDELVSEAAAASNELNPDYGTIDANGVRDALKLQMVDRSSIGDFAVGYVNGALRVARK